MGKSCLGATQRKSWFTSMKTSGKWGITLFFIVLQAREIYVIDGAWEAGGIICRHDFLHVLCLMHWKGLLHQYLVQRCDRLGGRCDWLTTVVATLDSSRKSTLIISDSCIGVLLDDVIGSYSVMLGSMTWGWFGRAYVSWMTLIRVWVAGASINGSRKQLANLLMNFTMCSYWGQAMKLTNLLRSYTSKTNERNQ